MNTTVDLASHIPTGTKTNTVPPNMSDRYRLRVKEVLTKPSSSGLPMLTVKCEIIDPQEKKFGDIMYDLTSLDPTYYVLLGNKPEGKRDNLQLAKDYFQKMGLPLQINPASPDISGFKDLCFDAILHSREKIRQRRNEKGDYEPITDSRGQPIKLGWELVCNLDEVVERVESVPRVY